MHWGVLITALAAIVMSDDLQFELYSAYDPTLVVAIVDREVFLMPKTDASATNQQTVFMKEGSKIKVGEYNLCAFGFIRKKMELCKFLMSDTDWVLVPVTGKISTYYLKTGDRSSCAVFNKNVTEKQRIRVGVCNGSIGNEFLYVPKSELSKITDPNRGLKVDLDYPLNFVPKPILPPVQSLPITPRAIRTSQIQKLGPNRFSYSRFETPFGYIPTYPAAINPTS